MGRRKALENRQKLKLLETVIIDQLKHIVQTIKGMENTMLHLSSEAAEYYVEWQRVREKSRIDSNDTNGMQIYSRLAPTVLKLAVLFKLGSADLNLNKDIKINCIKEACRQVDEYLLPTACEIYSLIGADTGKNNIYKIIQFLRSLYGKATREGDFASCKN